MNTVYFMLAASLCLMVYDFRTSRIPNFAVFFLLFIGFWANRPGTLEVWAATGFLLLAGFLVGGQVIGMGDIKLWLAWFWILPSMYVAQGVLIGFGAMFLTSIIEIAIRKARGAKLGTARPAAWRVFVATMLFVTASFTGWLHA